MMFYSKSREKKLKTKIDELEQENWELHNTVSTLIREVERRDLRIMEQQKRMRLFGIQIGNEEYEAEKLDFPSTLKL